MACLERDVVKNNPDVLAKVVNGDVTCPSKLKRYRFVVVLLIIVLTLYIVKPTILRPHLSDIRFGSLIIYLVLILVGFRWLMNKDLSDNQWSMLHFGFYLGLAYSVPNNWFMILIIQVLWEGFEDYQGFDNAKPIYVETDRKKMIDMIANSSGYLIGNWAFGSAKRASMWA